MQEACEGGTEGSRVVWVYDKTLKNIQVRVRWSKSALHGKSHPWGFLL